MFTAMLLGGMLRRSAALQPQSYSPQEYIENYVNIFVRGINCNAWLQLNKYYLVVIIVSG